jgi:hypothetical protein
MGRLYRSLFGTSAGTKKAAADRENHLSYATAGQGPARAPKSQQLSDLYYRYKDAFEKAKEEEMRKLDEAALKTRFRTGSLIGRLDVAVQESLKATEIPKKPEETEAPLEMPKELFEVLHSPLLRNAFRAYLKRKFAGESLAFFETIEMFKKVKLDEWRIQMAEGMMSRFVLEGAEFGVNISGADRSELIARMRTQYWPQDSFNAVQREMYDLMNNNHFQSFCRTFWPGGVLLAVPGGPFSHENLVIERAAGSTLSHDEFGSNSTTASEKNNAE